MMKHTYSNIKHVVNQYIFNNFKKKNSYYQQNCGKRCIMNKINKQETNIDNTDNKLENKEIIPNIDITKDNIILLFRDKIKGHSFIKKNNSYDCDEGQWIEKLFGIVPNSTNAPDIGWHELKKFSKIISFGD